MDLNQEMWLRKVCNMGCFHGHSEFPGWPGGRQHECTDYVVGEEWGAQWR